jgi:hypothetical protein
MILNGLVHDRCVDGIRHRPTEGNLIMDTNHSTNNHKPAARRGLAAGLAGGLLAGTAAGLVFGVPGLTSAATAPEPAALVQQTDETDTTTEDAPAEMGTHLRETLQALVDAGTITADQADAVTAHLVENRPERGEFGEGHGPGGHRGGPGMFGRGVASEALTDLLSIDGEELRTQLRDGATLAEIAEAQGVAVQDVVDVLVAEVTERVDNAVANGRIDQTEADEKLAEAEAKITEMVNNGRPERGTSDTED